jgi:hypothetical protein
VRTVLTSFVDIRARTGITAIVSAGGYDEALEFSGSPYSVFVSTILDGVNDGAADLNGDGTEDLLTYLQQNVMLKT